MFTEKQYYDKSQVCARLMISLSKLDRMLKDKNLPYLKLGRSVRILGSDINKFLKRKEQVAI